MFSFRYAIFFLCVAICIIWQLFLPGYVLTLDMVFTPEMHPQLSAFGYFNALPLEWAVRFFILFLPAWVLQKFIFVSLFFCIGFLSFRFLPVPKRETVRLFCALFYTVNPFVYTRFLAGQWTHLFAYAFLPLVLHFLLLLTESPNKKNSIKLLATTFLISIFSLHFFVFSILCIGLWFFCVFKKESKTYFVQFLQKTWVGFCGLILLICFLAIPSVVQWERFEQRFTRDHFEAFAPVAHKNIPVLLNLLSMNGFWGESGGWGKQFAWPQEYRFFWVALFILYSIVFVGIGVLWKKKEMHKHNLFFILLAFLAFILATGAGYTPFHNFNLFLFESIPFWEGFRDSQKFVALFVLSIGVFFGYGLEFCIGYFEHKSVWKQDIFRWSVVATLVGLGFFVWGGFRGQLQPVFYPTEWEEVRVLVKNVEKDEKVLFLPWHGYLSLNFNNNLLLVNPVTSYFGPPAVGSRSIEIKNVYDQEVDPLYRELDNLITSKNVINISYIIEQLVHQNISYIVLFDDLSEVDPITYPFLNSERLNKVIENSSLTVYKIRKE